VRVLLLATAYNGLTQRVHRELVIKNHQVSIELSSQSDHMIESVETFEPDLIICPFLKHRIPDAIWQQLACLVLHPGVAGDRGPSSLDWAVTDQCDIWGATLLQANAKFDAGAIWDSAEFIMRQATKAGLYRREITQLATRMIVNAVNLYARGKAMDVMEPIANNMLVGAEQDRWRPLMKQSHRQIDWHNDSGETILTKINAADSFPGVKDEINGRAVYLFGAQFEKLNTGNLRPGEIIGHKDEAICRACKDGGIWIQKLKLAPSKNKGYYKLPAMRLLSSDKKFVRNLPVLSSDVQRDIRVEVKEQVAYLYFDFYNGAFNTEQCQQLLNQFRITASDPDVKVVALMGGEDFWSNGIHLNCIEHAKDPALESWRNINAINDLVEALISCDSVLTIAALRNNAGAGGAILPLACDYVIAREGVVLNPHYRLMGLTGSEYWTFLLPKRVGKRKAKSLTTACLPLLADEALEINMVDAVFAENWYQYQQQLSKYCRTLAASGDYDTLIEARKKLRAKEESKQPLASYRYQELKQMKAIFDDPDSDYHKLRHNFVHKISCGKTPVRLINTQDKIKEKRMSAG